MKYSFIVPVHNSTKYINNCINSIIKDIKKANNETNTEIIVIENGSIDNPKEMLKKIINNNKNIKIRYFESDIGVSNARNTGIINSTGEYLLFVDSDDLWLTGSLAKIDQDIQKYNSDLYSYSYVKEKKDGTKFIVLQDYKPNFVFRNIDSAIEWMISKPTVHMQLWSKVYKSNIIKNNNILFNKDLKYAEDSEFVIRYLLKSNKIYFSTNIIYKYILSDNSTVRKNNQIRTNEYIKSINATQSVIKKKYKKSFAKYSLFQMNIVLVHDIFNINNKINYKNKMKIFKEITTKNVFKESLDVLSLKDCITKQLLPEFFMKLKMYHISSLGFIYKSYKNK